VTGTQGPTGASEPTDNRRVIRLPRATRLLAAWLACGAVAFALVWFSPLNLEHGRQAICSVYTPSGVQPCLLVSIATPIPSRYVCVKGGLCPDPYSAAPPKGTEWRTVQEARAAALPILVLRAAALGTALWVAYLGVRAVRSRVRFKVG
jgi:hypothetical protein